MNSNEDKLAAALLDLASEQFSNHGCNDFRISEHVDMTADEMRALDLAMHVWNGDPHEHDPNADHDYQSDFFLMSYLAAKLRGEA